MTEAVLHAYQDRLKSAESGLPEAQGKQSEALLLLVGAVAACAVLAYLALFQNAVPLLYGALLAPAAVFAVVFCARKYVQHRTGCQRQWRLVQFYRTGVARLKGDWAGKGVSGDEFSTPGHLYQTDLNILGTGSLFELLCTARTGIGRARLSTYLLHPPALAETVARQEAVKELLPQVALREDIWVLGRSQYQECDWDEFRDWLDVPALTVSAILPPVMRILSCVIGILTLAVILSPLTWSSLPPILIGFLMAQGFIGFMLAEKVAPVLKQVRFMAPELEILRQGLELVEKQEFHSAKLKELAENVRAKHAVAVIHRVERLLKLINECSRDAYYVPCFLFRADTQLILAIERWKAEHGEDLKLWLEAWAEFEALNALAGYAYEHPNDVFPEMLDGVVTFDAEGLGHPLLSEETCVRNDVHLSASLRLYVISGSNMAGKSTFLRSVGINAVLAAAGGPVRAARARCSSFAVSASLSIVDSLQEGKSKFLAEVERLRDMIQSARGDKPVLFVIDEIFAGTNSHDRRIAAESVIRALLSAGAVGALSTHDLALTEIADAPELHALNVHMTSPDAADPLAFDYRLKPGVNRTSNALAIARMAGVPV